MLRRLYAFRGAAESDVQRSLCFYDNALSKSTNWCSTIFTRKQRRWSKTCARGFHLLFDSYTKEALVIYLKGCLFGWSPSHAISNREKRRLPLRVRSYVVHEASISCFDEEKVTSFDAAALLWTYFGRVSPALTNHVIEMHRKIYKQ